LREAVDAADWGGGLQHKSTTSRGNLLTEKETSKKR